MTSQSTMGPGQRSRLQRVTAPDEFARRRGEHPAPLVERLHQRERALSGRRRILLAHLDRLQEALVAGDGDGDAAIDDVASMLLGARHEHIP